MTDETQTPPPAEKPVPPSASPPPNAWLGFAQGVFNLLTTIIETFGWSGTLVIAWFLFIVWYATPEQKQAIIDTYALGKDIGQMWPLILLSAVFVATTIAQHKWYKKKIKVLTDEVERIGREKGELQERLLSAKLQHASSTLKEGGKK
jgi:hypothetical protein